MPQFWPRGVLRLAKPDLYGVIAIGGNILYLGNSAWASLNHRDRNVRALWPKHLGHPHFLTQQSTQHSLSPQQRQTLGARDWLLHSMAAGGSFVTPFRSSWHQRVKDVSHWVSGSCLLSRYVISSDLPYTWHLVTGPAVTT